MKETEREFQRWVYENRWDWKTWICLLIPVLGSGYGFYLFHNCYMSLDSSLRDPRFPWTLAVPFVGWPIAIFIWFIRDYSKTLDRKLKGEELEKKAVELTQKKDENRRFDYHKYLEWAGTNEPNKTSLRIGAIQSLDIYKDVESCKVAIVEVYKAICSSSDTLPQIRKMVLQKLIKWRESLKQVDFCILDLTGANLSGADFSHVDMSKLNLTKANLENALMTGADISGKDQEKPSAQLMGANLIGAQLSKAFLVGADLEGARLQSANVMGANLIFANLTDADLSGAILTNALLGKAKMLNTNLSGADLSGADLSGADLSGADLSGADLSKVRLSGPDLSGADLSKVRLSGPYYATNADLSKFDQSLLKTLVPNALPKFEKANIFTTICSKAIRRQMLAMGAIVEAPKE